MRKARHGKRAARKAEGLCESIQELFFRIGFLARRAISVGLTQPLPLQEQDFFISDVESQNRLVVINQPDLNNTRIGNSDLLDNLIGGIPPSA